MTHMKVASALVSPCSIILHAKVLKNVSIVLNLSSLGCTLVWK